MDKLLRHILRPRVLLLVGILGLAAYLRLWRIADYMTFLGDEGRDMLVVKRILVDGKLTLLGPTASVGGFFLGPIYYYFMLPFVWAFRLDPAGPAVMVALFGIATVYLVYRLGKEMFDEWVGLAASSLYAVSPLVIAYSRSSWNPNVVPFFSTLLIYLLWKAAKNRSLFIWFWIGVIGGIGLQLHYLFLFLFVVAGFWWFLFGRTSLLKSLALLIVGFLVGYAPFLAFELRHNFPNTRSIIQFVGAGKDTGFRTATFFGNISDVSYRLFGRLVFRHLPVEQWVNIPLWQQMAWSIGTKFAIFSSIVLLVAFSARLISSVRVFQDRKKEKDYRTASLLLFTWLLIVVVLFGFYKRGIYDYYFGIIFAFPFLATSLVLSTFRLVGRWGIAVAVLVWVALLMLNWQGRPFRFAPNQQLAQAKMIASEAFSKTEGKPFNFALVANFNSDHAYRYFFEIWGNPPITIQNEVNDPERKTVTDQLIVICEIPDCKPLGHPLWEIAGFGRAEIAGEWDVSFVKIFKLVHWRGDADE